MKLNLVEKYLLQFFKWLSFHIGQRPRGFFYAPFIISFVLMSLTISKIVIENKINRETDIQYLYSTVNGFAHEDKDRIEQIFPINTTANFNFMTITDITKLHMAFVLIKPKDGGNILRSSIFNDIMHLYKRIENINITWNGNLWNYEGICTRNVGKCIRNSGNYIYKYINEIENGTHKLPYPFELNLRDLIVYAYGFDLGGIELGPDGTIQSAKTIVQYYYLDGMTQDKIDRAILWKNTILEFVNQLKMENIFVNFFHEHSVEIENEYNLITMIPYLAGGTVLILVVCMWAVNLDNVVRNKPWLAFVGCSNVLLSMIIAFSICILCNVVYIDMNIFIGFLLLGIGMDDTFMLISAWKQSSNLLTVEERVSEAFAHVGLSITLTSVTNLLSFIVGAISPVPAIHYFCIYMSASIICNFILQITSFGGAMIIFGHIEKQNKHSFFFWKTVVPTSTYKKSSSPKILPMLFKKNRFFRPMKIKLEASLKNRYNNIFLNTSFQISVILLFIAYISISIYGILILEEKIDLKRLVRTDSYVYEFLKIFDKYHSKFNICNQIVINKTIDYSNPVEENKIEKLIATFQSLTNSADFTWSWLKYYKQFSNHPAIKSMMSGLNMTVKKDFMLGLTDIFLKHPIGKVFKGDIKFNDNKTEIVASRFLIPVDQLDNISDKKQFFRELSNIKNNLPKDVYVYSYMYKLMESEISLKGDIFRSLSFCCIILTVIVIIFMPNLICIFWVTLSIISIQIGVIGFLGISGCRLDHTVVLALVMCVGLSVDYTSHFTYALSSSREERLKEKVFGALKSTGLPIIQSCISTLIGISSVFLLPSNTLLKSVYSIFLLILFSVFHSLILLPTLLLIRVRKNKIEHLDLDEKEISTVKSILDKFKSKDHQENGIKITNLPIKMKTIN